MTALGKWIDELPQAEKDRLANLMLSTDLVSRTCRMCGGEFIGWPTDMVCGECSGWEYLMARYPGCYDEAYARFRLSKKVSNIGVIH